MSRIGRLPIEIPIGVLVNITPTQVTVEGPKGKMNQKILPGIQVTKNDNVITVERDNDLRDSRAFHGLSRTLIANMVKGVTTGFEKGLEFNGVGFRAKVEDGKLILTMGYSHPVDIKASEDISFRVEENKIFVAGMSKEEVGMVAAKIRKVRLPEPYKGKGIKYIDEVIRRKAGKAGKTATAGSK